MENIALLPSQSTYISSNKNTINHAYSSILCVGAESEDSTYRSLLFFDLFLLPQNIVIESAFLKLHNINSKSADVPCNVIPYALKTDWDQYELTWENQPKINHSLCGKYYEDSNNGWDIWDISNLIKQWFLDKSSNLGLILMPEAVTGRNIKKFYSPNSSNREFYPVLDIKCSYNDSFCLGSRNTVNEVETFNSRDEIFCSTWKNTSQFSMYTFIVHNSGTYPVYVTAQISPNKQLSLDDGAVFSIPPGASEAIVSQRYAFFTRLCFKSSGYCNSTRVKIWFQAQV